MHVHQLAFVPALAGLLFMTACNFNDTSPSAASLSAEEERFHEKSFSWDAASGQLAKNRALAKGSARQTSFATAEEFVEAIGALETRLKDPVFTDSLWKPLDYACNELDLALWNTYGTIRVADSLVFDEDILRGRCSAIGNDTAAPPAEASALAKGAGFDWRWWEQHEVDHRVYPYKMIGRSWSNFNLIVYKSTGGETQFKKHREIFWVTAWWDLDASRIGVRAYLLNCGVNNVTYQKTCYPASTMTTWHSNDDYVSAADRGLAVGIKFTTALTPTLIVRDVRVNDAVLSMHSVNHAGIEFRARSSAGIDPGTPIESMFFAPEYVTW